MAGRTFLQLCKRMAREVGIPGSGPTTVVSQTGEHEKIVRYIVDADMDIKRRFIDWNFMWKDDFSVSVVANDVTINSATTGWPTNLGYWDPTAFYLDKTTDSFIHLDKVAYLHWRNHLNVGSQQTSQPSLIAIAPDMSLRLHNKSDGAYTLTGEYWKKPVEMESNTDESEIPEEFRRLIIVRAKIMYGEHEDAPEVLQGAGAEHDDLLNQMENRYLRGQGIRGFAQAPDSEVQVVIPQ